jgi:intraflagellar transport protein 172
MKKAAAVKEQERDVLGAVNLYLRSNMPAKAAKLLISHRELIHNQEMVGKIATTLIQSDLYENAGELFEKIKDDHKALECYKTGKVYRKAVELARHCSPGMMRKKISFVFNWCLRA